MTVELVTGHSNQQHVSAVDEALKNIGVYGAGVYLLPDDTNNYPTISMYNANTVQIAACNTLKTLQLPVVRADISVLTRLSRTISLIVMGTRP